jgi:hypothetical protein
MKRGGQEVRHHLSPEDDLKAVAAKLAAPAPGKRKASQEKKDEPRMNTDEHG